MLRFTTTLSIHTFLHVGMPVLAMLTLHGSTQANADEKPPVLSFDSTVKPFLAKHCLACHNAEKKRGKVELHKLDPAKLAGADAELWGKIVEVLQFAEMPPKSKPQPSKYEVERVTSWIKVQLAAAGKESDVDHKLQQPEFANLINHEKLFDGSIQGLAYSPPRLWRLHPLAYEVILADFGRSLNHAGPLSKPFVVGEGKGLPSNYAALARADSATLFQLMHNCRQLAHLQTVGFKVMQIDRRTKKMVERLFREAPASFEAILEADGEPTEDQLQTAVLEEFDIVLNRKPTDDEKRAFVALLRKAMDIGGKALGLRTMAMAVLLRPEAIYRMEVGFGEVDEHGRRMLSPHELAHAIAFALTDTPPDQLMLGPPKPNDRSKRPTPPSLLDLAESGKLRTREDVRAVVTQIWDNEAIDKPRILRFFQEFFGYHTAGAVFKGDRSDRIFSARHLIQDADQLVLHIVEEDRKVLAELLTTDRFFFQWPGSVQEYDRRIERMVEKIKKKNTPKSTDHRYFITRLEETGKRPIPQANPGWRKLAMLYNLDPKDWDYPLDQPFAMPTGQRCGILTHPTWLVAWSGNFGNDPIRRGKWIREHLLADSVPEVPITVDATVPQDPHKTLRQRLTKTREEYCWQCHQKMDPLGLPFESYTDFGRFRTSEGLGLTNLLQKPKKTAPLVTTGEIIDSGDPALDGEVKDVHELMHKLAKSERVRQSFVRHAFRYWMGRNEMLSDSPTLMSADRAYVENDGSFKAMVIDMLTSDSFLYRK